MISKVSISKVEHRGNTRLRVRFPFDKEAGELVNSMASSKWSQTYKSWLFPFEKSSVDIIRQYFSEIEFEDEDTRELEIPIITKNENDNDDEVLVWKDQDYIYLKVKATELQERSFLSGIELSRNYYGSGYWKIKFSSATAEVLKSRYRDRFRKWPSLLAEINEYDEKQRDKNKVTAVVVGKQVRVIFDWSKQVIDFIKTMPFHHWDPVNKWWSYAGSEKTIKALKDFCVENKFDLKIDKVSVLRTISKRAVDYNDPSYRKCPPDMIEILKNKRYAESTFRQYTSMFEEFINYHRKLALEDIGTTEIKEFIGYLVQERKVSPSYQNVAVNAIKFYYEKVLGGPRRFIDIDRPRREKHLPEVLSRAEVFSMISSIINQKHKFILVLLYSTGLRRGELLKLKLGDIDRDNMKIWVRGGKGNKDRYVQLGKNALKVLNEYLELYNPRDYLIEGRREQYSASSIAALIRTAAEKAGIEKNVTPHIFRHSYATHMLEDGIDTRFIQELLGHESIKTTQIYSHVTNNNINNITNPFDKMDI
jgi:site-specific recombinase XerD